MAINLLFLQGKVYKDGSIDQFVNCFLIFSNCSFYGVDLGVVRNLDFEDNFCYMIDIMFYNDYYLIF